MCVCVCVCVSVCVRERVCACVCCIVHKLTLCSPASRSRSCPPHTPQPKKAGHCPPSHAPQTPHLVHIHTHTPHLVHQQVVPDLALEHDGCVGHVDQLEASGPREPRQHALEHSALRILLAVLAPSLRTHTHANTHRGVTHTNGSPDHTHTKSLAFVLKVTQTHQKKKALCDI